VKRGADMNCDIESRWNVTVALFSSHLGNVGRILGAVEPGQRVYIGMVNRRHRLFMDGDLLLFVTSNGDGRYPVWCKSSRNYSMSGFYLGISINPGRKDGSQRVGQLGHFDVVDPEELAGFSPTAPEVRQFVVSYAQERVRRRVGAGSPTISKCVNCHAVFPGEVPDPCSACRQTGETRRMIELDAEGKNS
jgi:hypothetical protein